MIIDEEIEDAFGKILTSFLESWCLIGLAK